MKAKYSLKTSEVSPLTQKIEKSNRTLIRADFKPNKSIVYTIIAVSIGTETKKNGPRRAIETETVHRNKKCC